MTRNTLKTWRNPGFGATLLAALLLSGGASLTAAPAAFAHDQLVSSSPAPEKNLATPPGAITLKFSSPLLTLGHEVRVVDDSGTNLVTGAATLTRETLTQPLPELPDGGYQVSWRVVSADGHPISGGYRFSVGTPAAAVPTATSSAPAAGAKPSTAAGAADGGVPGWLPAAGLAAAAGLGLSLAVAGLRRIKRNTQLPND